MNKYKLIKYTFILLLVGCGRGNYDPNVDQGPMKSFVEEFISLGQTFGIDVSRARYIPIEFSTDLGDNVVGRCNQTELGKKILILQEFWESTTDEQRHVMLYHELGHCILGRSHMPDTAVSIMRKNVLGKKYYLEHKEDLERELFIY